MDSDKFCFGEVIHLNRSYPNATVEGRRDGAGCGGMLSCSITFESSTGFKMDFEQGCIRSDGVTLTLHAGSDRESPVLVGSLCHLHTRTTLWVLWPESSELIVVKFHSSALLVKWSINKI